MVNFNLWSTLPPIGPDTTDNCINYFTSYDSLPLLDNGYWSVKKNSNNFNGSYSVKLYNTGGTNGTGTNWTVAYAPDMANPYNNTSWNLIGTCDPTSIQSLNHRLYFNSPSNQFSSFNHYYASAQSSSFINSVQENEHDNHEIYLFNGNALIVDGVKKFDLKIFDLSGRQIYSNKDLRSGFGLTIPNGLYIVSISNNNGTAEFRKIVVTSND
jgi:hypothetical protein